MLVNIIEAKFDKAAIWLTLAAGASSLGVIHSPTLDPSRANQIFPTMYLIAAGFLWVSFVIQRRSEQIHEVQAHSLTFLPIMLEGCIA